MIELMDPVTTSVEVECFAAFAFTWDATHFAPHGPSAVHFEQCKHLHTFHISGLRKVNHSEREVWPQVLRVEMIEWLNSYFKEEAIGETGDLESLSCAALAKQLLIRFGLNECTVLEDGRAGATLRAVT